MSSAPTIECAFRDPTTILNSTRNLAELVGDRVQVLDGLIVASDRGIGGPIGSLILLLRSQPAAPSSSRCDPSPTFAWTACARASWPRCLDGVGGASHLENHQDRVRLVLRVEAHALLLGFRSRFAGRARGARGGDRRLRSMARESSS
ncbi:hypothetical protein PENTCL1PPCAC_9256 [Pristionchus entomophagus]|uniref:Uncharacterized protein n=1 Tax=Pristionchus entomophagus TaxID=358040 RepID=A0AAV5T5W4_9BILA|nr:hypothetical protein PENTCL1PPCAC_9256 [Pristionchus entomophagus]